MYSSSDPDNLETDSKTCKKATVWRVLYRTLREGKLKSFAGLLDGLNTYNYESVD